MADAETATPTRSVRLQVAPARQEESGAGIARMPRSAFQKLGITEGDVVEIVRGPKPAVPPDWRSLAVTGRARSAIRRHIRQTEKEESLRLGVSAMDQAFARVGKTRTGVSLRPAVDRFAVASEDELFDAIGRGRIMPADLLEADGLIEAMAG